jgi:hypothetical protein
VSAEGLVSWWRFDEMSRWILADSSATASVGVARESACASAISGTAIRFTSGFVDVGEALDTLALPFSLSAWVKTEALASPGSTIFFTDDRTEHSGAWAFINKDGRFEVGFGSAVSTAASSRRSFVGGPVLQGQWTHVAAIVKDAADATVYVDGVSTLHESSGTATEMTHATGAPMRIGGALRFGGMPFNGCIDELRIYSRALTPAEIAQLATRN